MAAWTPPWANLKELAARHDRKEIPVEELSKTLNPLYGDTPTPAALPLLTGLRRPFAPSGVRRPNGAAGLWVRDQTCDWLASLGLMDRIEAERKITRFLTSRRGRALLQEWAARKSAFGLYLAAYEPKDWEDKRLLHETLAKLDDKPRPWQGDDLATAVNKRMNNAFVVGTPFHQNGILGGAVNSVTAAGSPVSVAPSWMQAPPPASPFNYQQAALMAQYQQLKAQAEQQMAQQQYSHKQLAYGVAVAMDDMEKKDWASWL